MPRPQRGLLHVPAGSLRGKLSTDQTEQMSQRIQHVPLHAIHIYIYIYVSYQTLDGKRIGKKKITSIIGQPQYMLTNFAEVSDCSPICSINNVKLSFTSIKSHRSVFSLTPTHLDTNCQNWLEEQIIALSSARSEGQNSCPVKPDLEQLRGSW